MARSDRIELYRDESGDWRWRYVRSNGQVLAGPQEGYRKRKHCELMARLVTGDRGLRVVEVEQP